VRELLSRIGAKLPRQNFVPASQGVTGRAEDAGPAHLHFGAMQSLRLRAKTGYLVV
jgi:hypothetical protein